MANEREAKEQRYVERNRAPRGREKRTASRGEGRVEVGPRGGGIGHSVRRRFSWVNFAETGWMVAPVGHAVAGSLSAQKENGMEGVSEQKKAADWPPRVGNPDRLTGPGNPSTVE